MGNDPVNKTDPTGLCATDEKNCIEIHGDPNWKEPKPVWPADSKVINSKFEKNRYNPKSGVTRDHKGVDIKQPKGGETKSTEDGIVTKTGKEGSGENAITVLNDSGSQSTYRHQKSDVQPGDVVKAGQKIGEGDASGPYITGPHLHYEYRETPDSQPVDPLTTQLKDAYNNGQ
ncbi:MAG: hypothetical protein RIQ74_1904 [Pseudomonadota bacterium]